MAETFDVQITGAQAFAALSKRLKVADKALYRELNASVAKAVQPLRTAVKVSAIETLPRRGGLNKRVAASTFTTSKRTGTIRQGVRFTAKNRYDLAKMDDPGIVHHPVFGNRNTWVNDQPINPGFFKRPTEAVGPAAQKDVAEALLRIANIVEGRLL